MEAILKFDLPEDDFEYRTCNQASDMWSALIDVKDYFRNELKYNDKLTEEEYKVLESAQTRFFDILTDNKVTLDF
jgi:hypothetical protein